jgi:hypothetical protein
MEGAENTRLLREVWAANLAVAFKSRVDLQASPHIVTTVTDDFEKKSVGVWHRK